MPTYRIFIRRPDTLPQMWDFAQTVVASNEQVALGHAYSSWLHTNPVPHPPALSLCKYQINPVGAVLRNLAASNANPAQQSFMDSIQKQVSSFLSTQLDGAFSSVIYPQGFNYGITYGNNGYFNRATLQDIDTLLALDSNGMLDLTGEGFSTLYSQLMQAVTFSFSQHDQQAMNNQDTAASAQISSILTEFQNAGGTYSSPLPFGGRLQDVFNQLTTQFKSLDNIPDTLNALKNSIATYKSLAGDSYALHNRYYAATARIAAALNNTKNPSATNGGQQVDANSYYVGYTPNKLPTANQLIGTLNTTSNAINISISLDSFNSTSSKMSIAGGAGFDISIPSIIGISTNSSASYDLSRYTSSSSTVKMDITYPGVTLFASTPSLLSADNTTGWYANDIIKEVATKTGQDATGYRLQGSEFDVSELFGRGKTFSRLKTFVISQQPTIKLTLTGADSNQIVSDLQHQASVKVTLLGLFTLGSAAETYSVQNIDTTSSAGSVIVTFGPPAVSGTTPIQQQIAYVLGGVASYPPENI